jgi:hypothetical protein
MRLHRTDLKGFDAAVHLAALSNDQLGNLDSDLTYDIDHRGLGSASRVGQGDGGRFVFSSSSETAQLSPVTALLPFGIKGIHLDLAAWDVFPLGTNMPFFALERTATRVNSDIRTI